MADLPEINDETVNVLLRECVLCRTRRATGPCCSSHDRLLCHTCYRITHFVEVCVPHCAECIAEDLPLHLSDLEVA